MSGCPAIAVGYCLHMSVAALVLAAGRGERLGAETAKAFVPLAVGQELWGHRLGRRTSLRLTPSDDVSLDDAGTRYAAALRGELGLSGRLVVTPVRRAALEAARGSTDFGEYFVYFSFFLVVAGLLLAGLFFRLGLEQRLKEVGLLEALGFSAKGLRRLYLTEGLVLSAVGGAIGFVAAIGDVHRFVAASANSMDFFVIDYLESWSDQRLSDLSFDLIHPNSAGYEAISRVLAARLLEHGLFGIEHPGSAVVSAEEIR